MNRIEVQFEIKGFPGIVIDIDGAFWKLSFVSTDGRKFPARKLKPYYDRRYLAYRLNNTYISEAKLLEAKYPARKTVEL